MVTFEILSDAERKTLIDAKLRPPQWREYIKTHFSPKDRNWDAPVCILNLLFYIDSHGDFTSQNTKQAKLANAIFNSLDKDHRREVMLYLMESES